MSGGKGGSDTTSVEIPQYIEDAARRNLAKADQIAQIGNVVNPGPTSAAFTPMQSSAFQNTADTANAYGLNAPVGQADIQRGGMDEAQQYANGVRGYSSTPIYDQSMEAFGARDPGQKTFIDSMFMDKQNGELAYQPENFGSYGDPFAGGFGGSALNASDPNQGAMDAALDASMRAARDGGATRSGRFGDGSRGGGGGGLGDLGGIASGNFGGWDSYSDRFDGGGQGASGDTYSGGPFSGLFR